MKQDDTMNLMSTMNTMNTMKEMPSRIKASIETKDIGIAGGLLFIGVMIAVALFFS